VLLGANFGAMHGRITVLPTALLGHPVRFSDSICRTILCV